MNSICLSGWVVEMTTESISPSKVKTEGVLEDRRVVPSKAGDALVTERFNIVAFGKLALSMQRAEGKKIYINGRLKTHKRVEVIVKHFEIMEG